ncbi:MAG: hypothetical protein JSS07_05910 [Proteobacteria bacterium]|nr:hypothetical protein [Pseudomonadota bacterium]
MFNFKKAKIYFTAMAQRMTYPALLATAVGMIVGLSGFFILGYSKLAILLVSTLAMGAGIIARYALIKYLHYKNALTLKSQHQTSEQERLMLNEKALLALKSQHQASWQGPEPLVLYEIDTRVNVQFNDQTMMSALTQHGYFNRPSELIKRIFEFLPVDKSWHIRQVSKPFFFIWESIAQNKLRSLPIVPSINVDHPFNVLHDKQQDEISYLILNRENILNQHSNNETLRATLNIILQKLSFLKNKANGAAYHAKELHLNRFNEIIIRNQIAAKQQSKIINQFFECAGFHLTRFPSEIFSDSTLHEFWSKVSFLDLYNNQLTTLPDSIGVCTNLQWLRVYDNKLSSLPKALIESKTLTDLCILENCFLTLPENLKEDVITNKGLHKISKEACLALQKRLAIAVQIGAQQNTKKR